jgi:urea transport system permease protein
VTLFLPKGIAGLVGMIKTWRRSRTTAETQPEVSR